MCVCVCVCVVWCHATFNNETVRLNQKSSRERNEYLTRFSFSIIFRDLARASPAQESKLLGL